MSALPPIALPGLRLARPTPGSRRHERLRTDATYLGRRFSLEGLIGTGPSGEVYQAVDIERGKRLALKLLHPHETADPRFAVRFRHLCRALFPLAHDNLVALLDYGYLDTRYYLAMERVEGVDLARVLAQRRRLPPLEAAHIARGICRALEAIHQQGLVHQGLKPRNVLLTRQGSVVKVMDAGLASALSESGLSKTNFLLDGVRYLSPEHARGEPVGPASDLYSLGVLLFEMLTGRPVFQTNDLWEFVRLHGWGEPPSPTWYVPHVPPALSQITIRALQKTTGARYRSAEEMGLALDDFIHSYSHASTRPIVADLEPARLWSGTEGDRAWVESPVGPVRPARSANRSLTVALAGVLAAQFAAGFLVALAALLPLSRDLFPSLPILAADVDFSETQVALEESAGIVPLPPVPATPPPSYDGLAADLQPGGSASLADQPGQSPTPPLVSDRIQENSERASEDTGPKKQQTEEEGARGEPPAPKDPQDDEDDEEKKEEDKPEDREIEFWGLVQSMEAGRWRIAGREVVVTSRTEQEGRITLGSYVRVEAVLGTDGLWKALEIEQEEDEEDEQHGDD